MKTYKVAVLAGDGIGPLVMKRGFKNFNFYRTKIQF